MNSVSCSIKFNLQHVFSKLLICPTFLNISHKLQQVSFVKVYKEAVLTVFSPPHGET